MIFWIRSCNVGALCAATNPAKQSVHTAQRTLNRRLIVIVEITRMYAKYLRARSALGVPVAAPHRQPVYEIPFHRETQPRSSGYRNCALQRYRHLGFDDVLRPIATAGRDISRKREPGQC